MTYQEFLDELTEEEKELFIQNTSLERIKDYEQSLLHEWWLGCAFVWEDTEQGHDYWHSIDTRIHSKYGDKYLGS